MSSATHQVRRGEQRMRARAPGVVSIEVAHTAQLDEMNGQATRRSALLTRRTEEQYAHCRLRDSVSPHEQRAAARTYMPRGSLVTLSSPFHTKSMRT